MGLVTGWDVGGAHLKAARIEDGVVKDVAQFPALIWTDLVDLETALTHAIAQFGSSPIHAVTMTGELAEIFESRAEGVSRLTEMMTKAVPGKDLRIFAGRAGFVLPEEVGKHVGDIASANWYASAQVVGRSESDAIFVDIGSSTSDVIAVFGDKVCAKGYSDAERLSTGELIYTGAVRTPVMAVTDKVPFGGEWQGLMAERFAVMADVYRVLGCLPEDADLFPAVDDREKTAAGSRVRLARMLGRDVADAEDWQWEALARFLSERQLETLAESVHLTASRFSFLKDAPIVGAGAGKFIAKDLARRLERPYRDFADLVQGGDDCRDKISICAPAVAVGLLAEAG